MFDGKINGMFDRTFAVLKESHGSIAWHEQPSHGLSPHPSFPLVQTKHIAVHCKLVTKHITCLFGLFPFRRCSVLACIELAIQHSLSLLRQHYFLCSPSTPKSETFRCHDKTILTPRRPPYAVTLAHISAFKKKTGAPGTNSWDRLAGTVEATAVSLCAVAIADGMPSTPAQTCQYSS